VNAIRDWLDLAVP